MSFYFSSSDGLGGTVTSNASDVVIVEGDEEVDVWEFWEGDHVMFSPPPTMGDKNELELLLESLIPRDDGSQGESSGGNNNQGDNNRQQGGGGNTYWAGA